MSSFGNATIQPDTDKVVKEQQREGEVEQENRDAAREMRIAKETDARLKALLPRDSDPDLYESMENFLLGNPENQIAALGEPDSLIEKADGARKKGDNLIARAHYETAAKIAMYKQDMEGTKKNLELAGEVTENTKDEDKHWEMQKTILGNLDLVMRVAKEYYDSMPKA